MRGKHWKVLFISWSMDDKSVDQFVFIIYMMIKRLKSELKKFNLKTSIQPGYLYFEKEMRSAIIRFWS